MCKKTFSGISNQKIMQALMKLFYLQAFQYSRKNHTGLLTHNIQKSSAECKILFYITAICVDETVSRTLK
jgi:hypothetical protein